MGKKIQWSDEDEFELLNRIVAFGKNWDKILKWFHDKHRLTIITKKDKLRVKYNDLKSEKKSKYFKPYEIPDQDTKGWSKLNEEQQRLLELEHIQKHNAIKDKYEACKLQIKDIEDREKLRKTENGDKVCSVVVVFGVLCTQSYAGQK